MYKPKSISDQLLFTTVRLIVAKKNQKKFKKTDTRKATGFFFVYEREGKKFTFLVTNEHVIKDIEDGIFFLNELKNNSPDFSKKHSIRFKGDEWFAHPNEFIDVAVMLVSPHINKLYSEKNIELFYNPIFKGIIPDKEKLYEEINAIEDIVFIGCPKNIFDHEHLLPITRKGITASPINLDFKKKPIFLIDATVNRGSSGSPVFLYNDSSYLTKNRNIIFGERLYFLGVVASTIEDKCKILVEINNEEEINKVEFEYHQEINLGVVYKTETIIATIELYFIELEKQFNMQKENNKLSKK
ncbi:MAG: hypothetical protein ACTSRG_26420 [Candidatus Helarchaeota archaeon]